MWSVRHASVTEVLGCFVLPSTLALPFRIALVFVLVSAAVLQGAYSHAEKHMHVQRMRHKIASREGRASSALASRPLAGSTCFREISRMAWCAQGSLQSVRQRSRCEARKAASATRQCHSWPSKVLASWHLQPASCKLSGMARLGASERAAGRAFRTPHEVGITFRSGIGRPCQRRGRLSPPIPSIVASIFFSFLSFELYTFLSRP